MPLTTGPSRGEGWQAVGVGPHRKVRKANMKARVFVTLKPSVFDPQGQTIADALHSMGYAGIGDVRQGKYFELDVAAKSADQARTLAAEVADKLLANPVIESYRVEIE
jgi:phosphoribosylformylglycinamidine synthase